VTTVDVSFLNVDNALQRHNLTLTVQKS